jgi:hypothetical protein
MMISFFLPLAGGAASVAVAVDMRGSPAVRAVRAAMAAPFDLLQALLRPLPRAETPISGAETAL